MVLAMGVVPAVMVLGECGTWLGVMVLAMGVLPDVMYQVSMATGWGSWYLPYCGTWCDVSGDSVPG